MLEVVNHVDKVGTGFILRVPPMGCQGLLPQQGLPGSQQHWSILDLEAPSPTETLVVEVAGRGRGGNRQPSHQQ